MDKDLKYIIDFCQEYDMLPKSGTVMVCVSGGADSMCLLHMMRSLAGEIGFTVAAAHFNHNLRGAESDGDQNLVSRTCAQWGIYLVTGSGDVAGESRRRGTGIEETARDLRYKFFDEAADALGASKIATAHTSDDNLETVLLRIARGTGLSGLCGIPPVRGRIIRPLLTTSRRQVEAYDQLNHVPFRDDSTNFEDECSRNRVRHHVIPRLRELNPALEESSVKMISLLREDEAYLDGLAVKFLEENAGHGSVPAGKLGGLPFPVASRCVRKLCPGDLGLDHVRAVLALALSGDPSARLSLPGIQVWREYDRLFFGKFPGSAGFCETPLPCPGVLELPEAGVRITTEEIASIGGIYKSLTTFLFKKDDICGKISVRPRRAGDSVRLSLNSGSKSLKRLFIDKKIPARLRASIPVICDEAGPLAIPRIGCDVRVAPVPGDSVIKVKIEEI